MGWTLDELRGFFSEKLLQENLNDVVAELERMQAGHGLVAADHEELLLQGDVFSNVPCVERSGESVKIKGRHAILISNSCDASQYNPRMLPVDLSVAPLMRLSRYQQMLLEGGVDADRVASSVKSIKSQKTTHVVYIPAGGRLEEDMIALLDKVQSMPFNQFQANDPERKAVLTQRGFWVLLIKLSMHFLRPHEGVSRAA